MKYDKVEIIYYNWLIIEIVSYNQIIGKISCKVPLLGIWINILQNEYVFLFIIISLAFNLLYKKKSIL